MDIVKISTENIYKFKKIITFKPSATNSLPRMIAMYYFLTMAILLMNSGGTDAERIKRYYGGRNAQSGEHSWAVSIGLADGRAHHFCGGSIIDARYILSVAHCYQLMLPSEIVVRSGSIDIHSKNVVQTGVSRIICHPHYKTIVGNTSSSNDIAILKLDQNLELGSWMSAIRLPTEEPQEVSASFAAWGSLRKKPILPSRILQVSTMTVVSDTACKNGGLRGRRPQYICAYDANGLVLDGDSGSGLIYNGEIIGVAATSKNKVGRPCSFTNVYHYADWIKETTGLENNV